MATMVLAFQSNCASGAGIDLRQKIECSALVIGLNENRYLNLVLSSDVLITSSQESKS